MGLKKLWSDEEIAVLVVRYPHEPTGVIAEDLGRNFVQVYNKCHQLGLRKTPEFLSSAGRDRIQNLSQVANRFKPGFEPWNKGISFDSGGRSHETRFKPGSNPKNTLVVGSYRIEKNGILQLKISDSRGNASKRWRSVHELVWIEANGPVPEGHLVIFRRGQTTNKLEEITLDRIECISRSENMRRNSVHNLPKQLAELVQLRGVLNRQINKKGGK